MKKAIYTVITNNYDTLKEPRAISAGFEYICFTDNPELKSKLWKVVYIDRPSRHLQREIKVKPHEFLPNYKLTIYVDASMTIKRDLSGIVSKAELTFIQHPTRNCVYDEEKAVLEFNKDNKEITSKQIAKYRREKLPSNFGMFQTGIIIRRNTEAVREFCNTWWDEIEKHSHRDQLSVSYAVWKAGIKPLVMDSLIFNKYVVIHRHLNNFVPKKEDEKINIIYSTPARSDKNIGKAYNDFMETVPSGSWVCLRDGDTMFTTPDWPKHIEDIIAENANKFDLIGCVTNRLRGEHQLVEGMFNECDINAHIATAKSIRSNNVEAANGIAGLCLIFKKELWDKVKFKEKSIRFDTEFSQSVKKIGGRIGVAKGLYIFHLYRWGQKDPKNYIAHLL